jgi:hypothetical protein
LDYAVLPRKASCLLDTMGLCLDTPRLTPKALHQWAALEGGSDVRLLEQPVHSVVVPWIVALRIRVFRRRFRTARANVNRLQIPCQQAYGPLTTEIVAVPV